MASGRLLKIDYKRGDTEYTHIAPPCSSFKVSYADVDKEGSGRNSLTGEMFRERIGHYCKIDLTWDLIPNSQNYNNWYKVLTHLPPKFNASFLMPNGEIDTKEMYRTDISTELYLFVSKDDYQMWKGLATSFVEWNVNEYDDNTEAKIDWLVWKINENGVKQTKEVDGTQVEKALEEGWELE